MRIQCIKCREYFVDREIIIKSEDYQYVDLIPYCINCFNKYNEKR